MGSSSSAPVVEYTEAVVTKCGLVRGKVFTFEEKKYDAFLGIPFAEPPVGKLRFQKPEPVKPWSETKDCIAFGLRCPQKDSFIDKRMNIVGIGEAECLTLNVVAPREKSSEPSGYPVMVWIHGGGFAILSSSNFGDSTAARNLCSKGVIFVSINYRLGAFGFFTTGDEKCPGNFGMWDQTLALRWVQENIEAFGGNPKNVTIFGQSAGGASVDLLSLSPHSRDLFQRVIPMGGNAECQFSMRSKEDAASVSRNFARKIGWNGEDSDSEGLMEFITAQPTKSLIAIIAPDRNDYHSKEPGTMPFVPNFDGDFFPAPISELRKQIPKKDVLTGGTEFEGLILNFLMKVPFSIKGMEMSMDYVIKESEYGEEAVQIRKEIVEFYTKDVNPKDRETIRVKQAQCMGDSSISNGMVQYARNMAGLGHNVYFYNFEYCNPNGFGILGYFFPFKAATHGSEIRYILGKGIFMKFQPNEDDLQMLDVMTTYFTNFAKYGNPNGPNGDDEWKKHSSEEPYRYFNIHLPVSEMKDNYQDKRNEFWEKRVLPMNKAWSKIY